MGRKLPAMNSDSDIRHFRHFRLQGAENDGEGFCVQRVNLNRQCFDSESLLNDFRNDIL